jgi:uncharacterized coiled-coil DUF342 family protein
MNTQPTPISDRIVSQFRKGEATSDGLILTMVELELKLAAICRERDEARETIAATLRAWQTAQEKIITVTAHRDEAREVLKMTQEALVKAKAERVEALRERDEWKAKYIQQNKDLGCELRDPNGTIWDHAKTLQRELAEARKWSSKLADVGDDLRAELDEAQETIAAVTAQRDRLAEALREWAEIREWLGIDPYVRGYMKANLDFFNGLDEALQSLTQKEV